jgi:hypothetical protein
MTLDQLSAAATEGELLPCPFCGGPAEVESKRCGWRVHCIKPSCYTAGPYPDDCTEAEAITAWNQRTGQLVAVADDATVSGLRELLRHTSKVDASLTRCRKIVPNSASGPRKACA